MGRRFVCVSRAAERLTPFARYPVHIAGVWATVAFISDRAAIAVTRIYASFWAHPLAHSVLCYQLRICFVIYDKAYFIGMNFFVYYVIVNIY